MMRPQYQIAGQDHCPSCGVEMIAPCVPNAPNMRTKDHILPRSRGAHWLPRGVRNFRFMCMRCNGDLAIMFHCVAIRACIQAIADRRCIPFQRALQENFKALRHPISDPFVYPTRCST